VYLISENSSLPNDSAEWIPQKPVSYKATSAGSKTLYLWIKDTAGNISATKTAKCVVTNPL
jgi:PKD repeat protein